MKKLLASLVFVVALFCFLAPAQSAMVFNDNGASDVLTVYFNNVFPSSKTLTVHLFCTNTTVTDVVTPASFTECEGGGYAAKTLSNGVWTINEASSIYQSIYAQQNFTFTGPLTTNGTIYGFFIVDNSGTPNLIGAGLFGQEYTPANNGDHILVTPIIQLSHGTPVN
jgi:hypothetical protein